MFSEASAILFTGGRVSAPREVSVLRGGVPALRRGLCMELPPVLTSIDRHCSGRYASYWNTFLLSMCLNMVFMDTMCVHGNCYVYHCDIKDDFI